MSRPRLGRRGNVYVPRRSLEYRDLIAAVWRSAQNPKLSGKLCVSIVFTNPFRGDIDNLVKTVLDGLSGVAFEDDSQVIRLEAAIVRDKHTAPSTSISVKEVKNANETSE